MHRDFQSQNIIVRNGEACLIDFQGLRPGLAQYDLASLLLDPYVDLTAAEREELLAHYLSGLLGAGRPGQEQFLRLYDLCAMQRLMQALGAYCFLSREKGIVEFAGHIPAGEARLRWLIRETGGAWAGVFPDQ